MDFTAEQLADALRKLPDHPADMVELYYGMESSQVVIGKIRWMNTAGGMQFGFVIVTERGEGSGLYYPITQIDILAATIIRFLESRSTPGYHSVSHIFEVRFRFVPEYFTPNRFDVYLDNIPGMEGAETITLTLPENK